MRWIKYKILQSVVGEETILADKKVGYSDENLAIAQKEAYGGYEIVEDGQSYDKEPLAVELGGTGANNATDAKKNLSISDGVTPQFSIGTVTTLVSGSSATASITGTKERPVLNLGIPKGADGAGTAGSITDVRALQDRVATLEGRAGVTETKIKNIGLDIGDLQMFVDDIEFSLVKNWAFLLNNYVQNPIDYRFLIGDSSYTIDNLVLNQMPVVNTLNTTGQPFSTVSDYAIRMMPNIPISVLAAPIDFVVHDTLLCENISVKSAAVTNQVNEHITAYVHTIIVKFDRFSFDIRLEFFEVSQPCSYNYTLPSGNEAQPTYFDKAGIYYIDRHSTDFFLWTMSTDMDDNVVITPNIKMLFNEPITIPAKVVTYSEMEAYVQSVLSALQSAE